MAFGDALRTPLGWPGTVRVQGRRSHLRRQQRQEGERERAEQRAADERAAARSALRLDPDLARKLLETIEEPAPFPGVAGLKTTVFEKQCCAFCRGLHSRRCPAVKEIEYHLDGRVQRVRYWQEWDDSAVLWREDIEEAAAWQDEDQTAPAG